MNSRVVVIGGGITGRLFQFLVPSAEVFDWGPPPQRLTRQYGANYLWEPLEGLECRPFTVVTHVDGAAPTITSVARYKVKIGKGYETPVDLMRSQFREEMTGYDLVTVPESRVQYNCRAVEINLSGRRVIWSDGRITPYDILVSTIPLYALINLMSHDLLEVPKDVWTKAFQFQPIFVKVTQRPPDARYPEDVLYVNYLSDPAVDPYRLCDRFGERHYEGLTNMGVLPSKRLVPGKIHPLPDEVVRELAPWLRTHDIHCFGRFGAWAPDELVHQTYRRMQTFAKGLP